MKINPISINTIPLRSSVQNSVKADKPNHYQSYPAPPVDCLKAKFIPSFGKMKTVGEAVIYDRKTKEPVQATVKKDHYYNEYLIYHLFVGKKKVGEMTMMMHADLPDYYDDRLSDEDFIEDKTVPQVMSLRTIEGEKYSNIGTSLIGLAIDESMKTEHKGAIWVDSCKGYDKLSSPYRSGENPIPFYYKLGFRAIDGQDVKIRELLSKGDYENLPSLAFLHLSVDAARKFKDKSG